MLFQGQEFGASAPFLFFVDHNPELNQLVRQGRLRFLQQFASLASDQSAAHVPDPTEATTFERCKLDWTERERHRQTYRLHRDLLELRRTDPVIRLQGSHGIDGAVLGQEAFVIRFFAPDGDDRLLLVNLGRDLHLSPAPEPLLAPPERRFSWAPVGPLGSHKKFWHTLWSSEHPDYGGKGIYTLDAEENWWLPGHAAAVLVPEAQPEEPQIVRRGTAEAAEGGE
jgi:maltooligosyltrehalose trehalohydrolase